MSGIWRESDVSDDEDEAVNGADRRRAEPATDKWLSGSWPLKPFDGSLAINQRKAEWIRFRDQYERIVACKEAVGPRTKLAGLKIFAGDYLLSVIEIQEKLNERAADIYAATIAALNRYFNETCDISKERIKFREMKMNASEPFVDWVLRLEKQATFCGFEEAQRIEEFVQALLRRSIPVIAEKLYEMSDVFNNDLERITAHGRHLDYIRLEAQEGRSKIMSSDGGDANGRAADVDTEMVNVVHSRKPALGPIRQNFNRRGRFEPGYGKFRNRSGETRFQSKGNDAVDMNCSKCGRVHGPRECKAFRSQCFACGRMGHYQEFCFSRKNAKERPGHAEKVKSEAERINQLLTGSTNSPRNNKDPRIISCMIGAEDFEFLVDSGATVNTMTSHGWQRIKRNCRSVIQDLVLHPEEVLRSYANQRPLEVECSFRAYVSVLNQPLYLAKFFVVKGTELALLSYETAHKLNLISIASHDQLVNTIAVLDSAVEILKPDLDDTAKEFPKVRIDPVKIKVDCSVVPKQIIRYNIPKAFEKATNERLARMERRSIIERADKEGYIITHVSPLVLVPKGDNDFRIVIDYREVNKAIIREPFPMPSLDKIWSDIPEGTLVFTKFDLQEAYFHVVLDEAVRHLTTFMTANGLMRFTRLPFGLSCAPELFQRVMERILVSCKNVIVYLDDILIFASCLEELERHVASVEKVLKENNLTINDKKSVYNSKSVDFLGFTIDGSGILPTSKKISDIRNYERPRDTAELRSFLGMMTFISPFIKNFSHKTKPLRDLLATKARFDWSVNHQEAFEALKEAAENDLVKRGYFSKDDRTLLYTDASPWGLGAVLVQDCGRDANHRIIACASKSLTPAESRYPQLHREALAIVWGMEKFSYYLLGRKFILRSDSEALMFMRKDKYRKDVGKRILSRADGWLLRTEHFWYEFEHVAGKDNIADAASRIGTKRNDPKFSTEKEPQELCSVTADPEAINEQLLALTTKQVVTTLREDEELQMVMKWLEKKEKWPAVISKYQAFQGDLYVQGETLMKQEKMVLPTALRLRALRLAHRSHPGMSTMKNFLRQGLWWPGMDREIEQFVRSCPECQLVTVTGSPPPITLTELPQNPWDYVSMDFASASEVQNWKALVLTDNYSRFLVALPMEKTDGEAVKRALKRIFNTYYIPRTMKADNGPPFNSGDLESWLSDNWGVKLIHSTPLNPTENGLVERSMQGINKITAIAKLEKRNWKDALSDYVAAYNTWPHHVMKIPPAELMFGRTVRSILPDLRTDQRQMLDDELRDKDQTAKFTRNQREDSARRAREVEIEVGDIVLVRQQKRDKTDTPYKNSLHKVIKITGAGRATITEIASNKTFDRNVKCLKRYVERKNIESIDSDSDVSAEEVAQGNQLDRHESGTERQSDTSTEPEKKDSLAKGREPRVTRLPQRYLDFVDMDSADV